MNRYVSVVRGFLVLAWVLAQIVIHSAPAEAAGNTYYVATDGNDTNPGTFSLPWRTIQKAANAMTVGDSVYVSSGTYNESVSVSQSGSSPSQMISFIANGTVQINGAIELYGDYISVQGFTVTPSACDWKGAIHVDGSYDLILNNTILNSARIGIETVSAQMSSRGVDSKGDVIRGNKINHAAGTSMYILGNNHLIENNEITRQWNGTCGNGNGDGDAFMFHGSGHTFRGNYIHDFYKSDMTQPDHVDAFQTFSDPAWGKWSAKNTIIEGNHIFLGHAGTLEEAWDGTNSICGFMIGGTLSDVASNIIIRNNIIESWCGLNMAGSGGEIDYLQVYNNTWRSSLNFNAGYWPHGINLDGATNFRVYNNITVDFAYDHIGINSGTTWGGQYGHNLMWNSDGSAPRLDGYVVQPSDLVGINPLFVSDFTDLHLSGGSPAIGSGLTISSVTNDIDGVERPQGAGYDIGAYEYVSTLTPPPTTTIPTSPVFLPLIGDTSVGSLQAPDSSDIASASQ